MKKEQYTKMSRLIKLTYNVPKYWNKHNKINKSLNLKGANQRTQNIVGQQPKKELKNIKRQKKKKSQKDLSKNTSTYIECMKQSTWNTNLSRKNRTEVKNRANKGKTI